MSSNKKKKDILFLGLHRPNRSPSQRYRIEQFLPALEKNKRTFEYEYLLSEAMDKKFYAPGAFFSKGIIVLKSVLKLLAISFIRARKFEYVFVQREAFMLGTAFFEKAIAKRSKLIFDFDDSIWLANVSEANKKLAFLKNPNKIKQIIQAAHVNIVGNHFLQEYAKQFSEAVELIPTCIDTNDYSRSSPLRPKIDNTVCIGWSGSQTTIEHFKLAIPILEAIKKKYGNRIYFKVIGDASYQHKELEINGIEWTKETEIKELEEIDIGIMPLPNGEWSKGKCGLKGLVYMSMEIPSVLAAVGVNKEIIFDQENGLLCTTDESWVKKLSLLIENKELRQKLGEAGRKTVVKGYSIHANKNHFLSLINGKA